MNLFYNQDITFYFSWRARKVAKEARPTAQNFPRTEGFHGGIKNSLDCLM